MHISIDLAKPRTIVIRQGAKVRSFTVPPIHESVWLKYFDGIVSTAERDGKQVVQRIDTTSAGLDLVETVLDAATLASVPLAHRLAVANVLTSAYAPADAQEEALNFASGDAVLLHAVWSAGDQGAMRRHKDLVHIFKTPTAEQNRRYRRDDSRAQVVSGSRKGTTIYHGAQRTLAKLYDELILSVSGYELNGEPLTDSIEAITRHMDTYHKVAAAAQLFAPAEVEIEEEDGE
jgi:hypothetical protein